MSRQKIALIVTVKNEADTLVILRQDLEQQTLQPDEIIITVAASQDDTLQVAEAWEKTNKRVEVFSLPDANRSVGRNRGVEASSSNILLFTDAGCRFDPTWVAAMTAPFKNPEVELVSGLAVGAPENDWEAAQVPFTLVLLQDMPKNPLPATRAMAARREAFLRVGPFQESLTWAAEDFEWSRRAVGSGLQPVFAADAVVRWRPRKTKLDFWRMLHIHTLGDVQADTWRFGHASMLGRYGFLVGLSIFSPVAAGSVWAGYIGIKSLLISKKAKTNWWLTAQAQALADAAVVTGVLRGVFQKYNSRND